MCNDKCFSSLFSTGMAKSKAKVHCGRCTKKCSGEVLRVQDKYYHPNCFQCDVCHRTLAQGGFFSHNSKFFCPEDYQRHAGTKCTGCGQLVEGEVVSAMGGFFHQACFVCTKCRRPFPPGEKVALLGKDCLCCRCAGVSEREPSLSPTRSGGQTGGHRSRSAIPASRQQANGDTNAKDRCQGCKGIMKDKDFPLVALDKQWHVWCFRCTACNAVLHGEFMGKGGKPYCHEDYQRLFGVKCQYCNRVIVGRVIQTGLKGGETLYFHPTCARCSKCGDPFGDGEDMLMQGTAIWHPRCDQYASSLYDPRDRRGYAGSDYDGLSTASETHSLVGLRPISPGIVRRDYSNPHIIDDLHRLPVYSYLTGEPSMGYLKRPIHPYDKAPKSPQFHRPHSVGSMRSPSGTPRSRSRQGGRSAMDVMAEAIVRAETPNSPGPAPMNNEEPIELSTYPAAKVPRADEPAKIERDDFPAPPFPYTDPERRRRWSGKAEEEDENDSKENDDPKLAREKEGLTKLAGKGIGKVFLKDAMEREKLRAKQRANLDPRRSSRVPSAKMEPKERLRFSQPHYASPSRISDHPLPWNEEDDFDRSLSIRSSVGRSLGTLPTYLHPPGSARSSGRRPYTLPPPGSAPHSARPGFDASLDVSTDISIDRLNDSMGSITAVATTAPLPNSETFASEQQTAANYTHSLPNMAPKLYPPHLLYTTNYRLPSDVERCNLEQHLADGDFEMIFEMSKPQFYRLPRWRQIDLKKRARLF